MDLGWIEDCSKSGVTTGQYCMQQGPISCWGTGGPPLDNILLNLNLTSSLGGVVSHIYIRKLSVSLVPTRVSGAVQQFE